jgi:hypothetical protein
MVTKNSGEMDASFPRLTDYSDTCILAADFVLDESLCFVSILPPQMRTTADLEPALVDPQINRLLGSSRDP